MKLTEFLNEYGIRYWTHGNNVAKGWINITCVFCDDSSNHLGIRKRDLKVSCWKCGRHSIGTLVSRLAECSFNEAKKIIRSLEQGTSELSPSEEKNAISPFEIVRPSRVTLPPEASKDFPKLHIDYLRKRGFNPRKIIKTFDLYACYSFGRFKFRIIIPIYKNNKMVAYTSRDVTGEKKLRYKAAKNEDCVINPTELIYNIDTVLPGQDAINVEGPADVWKMGAGSFCFMGITITEKRIIEIADKKIKKLFILYDRDGMARRKAIQHARILAPVVKSIEVISLRRHKDPGELKYTEVEEIKRAIDFEYQNE